MTIVGLLSILAGIMLSLMLAVGTRSILCVPLFLYHTAASFLYWLYSLSAPADASAYYAAPHDPYADLKPGTPVVRWLTTSIRDTLDASYLDLFMLFHIAGYAGVVLLYALCRRTIEQHVVDDRRAASLAYLVAFLPGLHVWTSAIGKDGLVFLGILCVLWSTAHARIKIEFLLSGLAICGLIRPHIAFLLAASCGAALAVGGGVALHWRAVLLGLLCVALWRGIPYLEDFLKLEELNSTSVIDYVEQRQGYNLEGGSSVDIADYSLPSQLFTFLYRPLFVDANGVLGIVVSVENLFYLGLSALCLPRVFAVVLRGQADFPFRVNFLFWSAGTLILASTTSNLGLAIRQKSMVMPSLVLMSLAVYARERRNRAALNPEEQTAAAITVVNQA